MIFNGTTLSLYVDGTLIQPGLTGLLPLEHLGSTFSICSSHWQGKLRILTHCYTNYCTRTDPRTCEGCGDGTTVVR